MNTGKCTHVSTVCKDGLLVKHCDTFEDMEVDTTWEEYLTEI